MEQADALARATAEDTEEDEVETEAAARRTAARLTARGAIQMILENIGAKIVQDILTPLSIDIATSVDAIVDDNVNAEHARYVTTVKQLNAVLTAMKVPENNSITFSREELFERDRYERFHLQLEAILSNVDRTRANI